MPNVSKAWTLGQLSEQLDLKCVGEGTTPIQRATSFEEARSGDICFLGDQKYRKFLKTTRASAVILSEADLEFCSLPALVAPKPRLAYARVLSLLYPMPLEKPGIHPTAIVSEGAEIDPSASVGPYCTIAEGVVIAAGVVISSHANIAEGVQIGEGTRFYPKVTIYSGVSIGQACILHSGVVIGSDGFGFENDAGRWVKVPQVGSVRIGDRVEIGANTTVDRGALGDTVIESGCILDNLIQVGHNVSIGEGTAIAAFVVIGGSAKIGRFCLIGGASIINGHVTLTDGVQLAGNAQVANHIKSPGAYASAITAREMSKWKRNLARFHHLDELSRRVLALEKVLVSGSEGRDSQVLLGEGVHDGE